MACFGPGRKSAQQHHANRSGHRESRAHHERRTRARVIPHVSEQQGRREGTEADSQVVPAIRRPPTLGTNEIGDERPLRSLGEPEVHAVHTE